MATPFETDQSNGSGAGTTSRRLLPATVLLLGMVALQACQPERSAPRRSDTQMREMALPEVRLWRGTPGARPANPRAKLKAGTR